MQNHVVDAVEESDVSGTDTCFYECCTTRAPSSHCTAAHAAAARSLTQFETLQQEIGRRRCSMHVEEHFIMLHHACMAAVQFERSSADRGHAKHTNYSNTGTVNEK